VNALVRKLGNYLDLTETERRILLDATPETARFPARGDIIHQGDRPHVVNLLLTGLAYRYKMLEDGRRQVLAVFVPGDFCDMRNFILERMDHSIGALTEVTVSQLRPDAFETLINTSSRLRDAFWWAKLVDDAITREWIVNIGQRTAMERTAHFLCELFWRLRSVGLTREHACEFPFTQIELADTLGLSAVHVNRTLQELRREGLIVLHDRELAMPDLDRLQSAAAFDPGYLHLRRPAQGNPWWPQDSRPA
jgi:CRP-like cAMP-binding protein